MNKTELLLQDDRCLQNYNICSHVIKTLMLWKLLKLVFTFLLLSNIPQCQQNE